MILLCKKNANYLKMIFFSFLLLLKIYNMKFTILIIFNCIVQGH